MMRTWIAAIAITVAIVGSAAYAGGQWRGNESPREAVYHDLVVTTLTPTIEAAIYDFYAGAHGNLRHVPSFTEWYVDILDVYRSNGEGRAHFVVELEVQPYLGAHVVVGRDRMSIAVSPSGEQTLVAYTHWDGPPLPDHLKDWYREVPVR